MLGSQAQGSGDVPELDVQVHDHRVHRRCPAEAHGQIGRDGGLADTALGGRDDDDPGVVVGESRTGFTGGPPLERDPPARLRGVQDPRHRAEDSVGIGVHVKHVAEAGPHGRHRKGHVGGGHEHQGDLGPLDVEQSAEPQGIVEVQAGSEDHDRGEFTERATQQLVRRGRQCGAEDGLHLAGQAPVDALAELDVVGRVLGDQQDAAHSKSLLVAPLAFCSASFGSKDSQIRPNSEA